MTFLIMMVSLFFVLEFVGVYFASYESLSALTELHKTIHNITEVRQLRTVISSETEMYRKAGNIPLISDEIILLKNAFEREDQLIKNSITASADNKEVLSLILAAEKNIKTTEPMLAPLLNGVKISKTDVLLLDQIFLEVQDSLGKIQLVLADQSDAIFDRIYKSRFLPLTIGIALSLIFLFFVMWVGLSFRKKIGRGIHSLVDATKSIADGNLDVHTEIIEHDEIGLLSNAFNVMAKNLQESTYSKAYVEGILESMLNAVMVVDQKGNIKRANRVSSEIFGYGIADLLKMNIRDVLPELRSAIGTYESIGLEKSKTRFPVNVAISPLDEKNTYTSGLRVCVVQDISESKKLETEIKERNHALYLANQELEAFSYTVSHDLRAPLRAIDGFSQALLDDCAPQLSEEGKHFLSRIRFGVQRMGDLIDAVINLAKISRASMVITKVDLSHMVHEIIDDLKHLEPNRKVEVKIQDGLMADADSLLLKITMENLLGNAWKYTAKNPNAHIEFGQTGQENKVKIYYVKDDGAGFDMAFASKLFAPFQRLHAQTEFSGTGVGLASVKRVVQRHGGTIWVESKPNEGSTFFFTLNS